MEEEFSTFNIHIISPSPLDSYFDLTIADLLNTIAINLVKDYRNIIFVYIFRDRLQIVCKLRYTNPSMYVSTATWAANQSAGSKYILNSGMIGTDNRSYVVRGTVTNQKYFREAFWEEVANEYPDYEENTFKEQRNGRIAYLKSHKLYDDVTTHSVALRDNLPDFDKDPTYIDKIFDIYHEREEPYNEKT